VNITNSTLVTSLPLVQRWECWRYLLHPDQRRGGRDHWDLRLASRGEHLQRERQ
jgi:hypothetical protein